MLIARPACVGPIISARRRDVRPTATRGRPVARTATARRAFARQACAKSLRVPRIAPGVRPAAPTTIARRACATTAHAADGWWSIVERWQEGRQVSTRESPAQPPASVRDVRGRVMSPARAHHWGSASVTNFSSVRPLASSVHCCSKVSRRCWTTPGCRGHTPHRASSTSRAGLFISFRH
jgi:hypothetical protein